MKHLKLLGLAAMAAGIVIAFPADSAAAGSVLCATTESPCKESNRWAAGTELDLSIAAGTSSGLTNTALETIDTCNGATAKGKLEKAEAVTASIEALTWSGCAFTTTTLKAGKLEVTNIAGTSNGTVTSDTITEVTVNTVLFGSCIYGIKAGGSLGDLTEGKPAVLHVNAVPTKQSGSAFACPETSKWTATFTLTEPKEKTLSVETG